MQALHISIVIACVRGQKVTCRSHFSHSTMWVSGVRLRSLGLVARRACLLNHLSICYMFFPPGCILSGWGCGQWQSIVESSCYSFQISLAWGEQSYLTLSWTKKYGSLFGECFWKSTVWGIDNATSRVFCGKGASLRHRKNFRTPDPRTTGCSGVRNLCEA